MFRSLKWQENRLLSVKVSDNLFTLAQMRVNYLMEFFDVFRSDEQWQGTDLNNENMLFCIFVATNNLKSLFSDKPVQGVAANSRPIRKRMLSAVYGQPGHMGADLIDLADTYTNIGAEIIKASLTPEQDLQLIYDYELSGMEGNPERVQNRLKVYYDTGVNWDQAKVFLFPDIQPPQPKR